MPSIDERVVSMAFENSTFESRVSVTIATLGRLDTALKNLGGTTGFDKIEAAASRVTLQAPMSALDKLKIRLSGAGQGAAEGLGEIDRAGNKVTLEGPSRAFDKLQTKMGQLNAGTTFTSIEGASDRVTLSGLTSAIDAAASKFSILSGAASVALGGIASQAALKGAAFAKSFAFGPIQQGLGEYQTNLNSIQTILANTQGQQVTGLQNVNKYLGELNTYSDKTIYNFSEMAKNIGTFTAAGVELPKATESIKGIANLAALSGSSSQQASTAMYQLSQAIAAGKVNLQDWNSVVNAGMGGAVFQKALFNTGKAMGTITNSPVGQTFEEWKKAGNSFRQSLSASQKAAQDGTTALAKAQKDGAKSVADAQAASADAVTNAAERVRDAQVSASEDVANAADRVKEAQKSAADEVSAAAARVKEAQKGVSETAKESAANMQEAQDAQRETFKQAAEDVKGALDAVTEARKRLVEALKPPSEDELQAAADKLKTAQLDQADLATAITDAQTDQKRATEDLASAQKRLGEAQSSGNSDAIRDALRGVEDAQKRVTDSSDAVARATLRQNAANRELHSSEKDLQELQKKGTATDKNVSSARDALTEATNKYAEAQKKAQKDQLAAEKNVTEVRLKGIEAQREAGRKLAQAEADQSDTIRKSREKVADAEKDQAKTIIDSRKKVADAEKDQAKTIIDSREKVAAAVTASTESIKRARDAMSGGQGPAPSWLTSDVLTSTLQQFAGGMTDAQLAAQGFNAEQIKAIRATAKTAQDAATQVKTLSQVFDVAKETIGSGWAKTFQLIFGDFTEAKGSFTELSNYINGAINNAAEARNKMLGDWKALGGRTALIDGLKAGFEDFLAIIKPISDAFHDIFPAQTGKSLFEFTTRFRDFMRDLKPGAEVVDGIRRTFRGFFAALHIGFAIVKGVVGVIGDLLGLAGKGSGGFLAFTGNIGDFVVALDNALTKGGLLEAFFKGLSTVLQQPLKLIGAIASAIAGLFGFDTDPGKGFEDTLSGVNSKLGPMQGILDKVSAAWDTFTGALGRVKTALEPWFSKIAAAFQGFGDMLAATFEGLDFDKIMQGLQVALSGGIFLMLKKLVGGGGLFGELNKSLDGVNGVLNGLTGNLEAMQTKIHAEALMAIGAAIALLAAGIFILSTINGEDLSKAMTAVAIGLGQLMGAMKLLTAGTGGALKGALVMPFIAASMILLAGATVVLAGAMKIFATMEWEDLAKGLAGVGGAISTLSLAAKLIPPTLPLAAAGMILLGVALNIIALAVKQFGSMDLQDIAKGIFGIMESIGAIGVAMKLIPPTLALSAAGLLIMGVALATVGLAVRSFGSMDLSTMVKGLLGVVAAIVGIGLAVSIIPPTIALQAAGLFILGNALVVVASAIKIMGGLSIGTLVKGIVGFAGTLVILAAGLYAMSGTLPGAAALLVAAGGLAVLAPVLGVLGTMKWSTIFKGLAAVALSMITLSLASLVAAPGLALLGLALIPLGLGLLAVAGAAKLFASALSIMGSTSQKNLAAIMVALTAFVAMIPNLVISFVKGLLSIADQLTVLAPKVVLALGVIIDTIIAFVIKSAPQLAIAIGVLVDSILKVLLENTPKIIAAGAQLILDLLNGLSQNITQITDKANEVVLKFLAALAGKAQEITVAGIKVIIAVINGIASKVEDLAKAADNLMIKFVTAIGAHAVNVVKMAANLMVQFVGGIVAAIPNIVAKAAGIVLAFLEGLGRNLTQVVAKGAELIISFIRGITSKMNEIARKGADAVIVFLNTLADTIREKGPELRQAGLNIADAMFGGLYDGLHEMGQKVLDELGIVAKLMPKKVRKILGIDSPSKVFMAIGQYTMLGLANGIGDGSSNVVSTATNVGDATALALSNSLSDAVNAEIDPNVTITPVLDLSSVQKSAKQLDGYLNVTPITAAASYQQATAASQEVSATQKTSAAAAAAGGGTTFEYVQNNYSPESLSDVEIYRQTRNQISQVKNALGV